MTQAANPGRLVSVGAEPAPDSNQRQAARFTPLIRTAKLVGASGEFLCVVSDVSSSGVSVRLFHPLPEDRALSLEMPCGDCLPIEPVWEKDGRAGFRFATDVDLDRVLEGRGEWPKRPIRLNLEMPVTLSGLTGTFDAEVSNISLQGAQVVCGHRLAIDQRLRMKGPLLPEVETKVRWRQDKNFGLIFDSLLQFADLARIAAALQGISAPRPNA